MPRWSAIPILGALSSTALLGALALGPAPASAYGADTTGAPPAADTPDPGDSQSPPPPSESATPIPTDSTPPSASPTPQQPTLSPSAIESGPHGHRPVLTVTAYASNAVLGPGYWRGARTTSFTVTVHNTGTVAAAVRVDYAVPAGVSDAATGACGHGRCSMPSVAPGAVVTAPIAVTVSPDAWRQAPLTGQFTVSARAPRAHAASGRGTWGVVFPPGPPAPGIGLSVDDVTTGNGPDASGPLRITLTNTSSMPAAAGLDVVVPHGVGTGPLPAGCARQPEPTVVRCVLGTVPPGQQKPVVVPLTVGAAARAGTPLTGLVRATLTAADRQARTAQASYQILVPAGLSGVTASSVIDPGVISSGSASAVPLAVAERGRDAAVGGHSAIAWPVIAGSSAVLVIVIVGLALGLRRPTTDAGPAAPAVGAVALIPAPAGPDRRGSGGPRLAAGARLGPDARVGLGSRPMSVPRPSSPVRLEWVEPPGSVTPPGSVSPSGSVVPAGSVLPAGRVASAADPVTADSPRLSADPARLSADPPEPSADPAQPSVNPPQPSGNPPEVELAEVAAELAEVAAILAGPGPGPGPGPGLGLGPGLGRTDRRV